MTMVYLSYVHITTATVIILVMVLFLQRMKKPKAKVIHAACNHRVQLDEDCFLIGLHGA
jgi:hypothetical protein